MYRHARLSQSKWTFIKISRPNVNLFHFVTVIVVLTNQLFPIAKTIVIRIIKWRLNPKSKYVAISGPPRNEYLPRFRCHDPWRYQMHSIAVYIYKMLRLSNISIVCDSLLLHSNWSVSVFRNFSTLIYVKAFCNVAPRFSYVLMKCLCEQLEHWDIKESNQFQHFEYLNRSTIPRRVKKKTYIECLAKPSD